jgi:hypothetical protein
MLRIIVHEKNSLKINTYKFVGLCLYFVDGCSKRKVEWRLQLPKLKWYITYMVYMEIFTAQNDAND